MDFPYHFFLSKVFIKIMHIYGEKIVEISCKFCNKVGDFYKIDFVDYNKTGYIPNYLIKHQLKESTKEIFVIQLPIWFLKKNRIIPIY